MGTKEEERSFTRFFLLSVVLEINSNPLVKVRTLVFPETIVRGFTLTSIDNFFLKPLPDFHFVVYFWISLLHTF